MANGGDSSFPLEDFIALVKLYQAVGGIFIWETVITAGFELDVLRRKRPYRWTIWLYLGTRYTGLLAFVFFFIDIDSSKVLCKRFMISYFALGFASWAFASLIIVLRVIAIWNSNIFVSLTAVCVWLGGIALHIRRLTMLAGMYNPIIDACIMLHTRRALANALGALVVDGMLLLTMFIGLLRSIYRNPTGIWQLLYQQCIIWLALALIAEIPVVVLIFLDLNDAWNEMLVATELAILSIGAARMYRSLSDRGSFTEYVLQDTMPQLPSRTPTPTTHRGLSSVRGSMHFAFVTQSEGTETADEAVAFLPNAQMHV